MLCKGTLTATNSRSNESKTIETSALRVLTRDDCDRYDGRLTQESALHVVMK